MLNTAYERLIDPDTKVETLIPPDTYLWITENRESVYYQKGKFYRGHGEGEIRWQDVPQFFWDIVRRSYSPEYIEKLGLKFPEERKLTADEKCEEGIKRGKEPWKCDECGKVLTFSGKAMHKAMHVNKRMREMREKKKNNLGRQKETEVLQEV